MNTTTPPHHGVTEFLKDVSASFNKMGAAGFVWLIAVAFPAAYAIYKVGRESAPTPQTATQQVAGQKEAIESLNKVIADQRDSVDLKDKELQRMSRELTELTGKLDATTRRLQTSEGEASRLKQELSVAAARTSTSTSQSQMPTLPVRSVPTTSNIGQAIASPAAQAPPPPHRQSIDLVGGKPTVIDQNLTVTLNYTRRYGGQFVINGQKMSYQTIGTRIDVADAVGKKCFIEVMTLSPEGVSPPSARLDFVCASS